MTSGKSLQLSEPQFSHLQNRATDHTYHYTGDAGQIPGRVPPKMSASPITIVIIAGGACESGHAHCKGQRGRASRGERSLVSWETDVCGLGTFLCLHTFLGKQHEFFSLNSLALYPSKPLPRAAPGLSAVKLQAGVGKQKCAFVSVARSRNYFLFFSTGLAIARANGWRWEGESGAHWVGIPAMSPLAMPGYCTLSSAHS